MKSSSHLSIRNATENNLKGIDLDLEHDTFVAITGLSGSGKSSLAFDTIYAEGQRRYIETFSPYTRQFFDKVKKPKVDTVENVRPAVAIQQRTRILNSRSTVGSMTDIDDLLRIVWSNVATPVCPRCGLELTRWDAPRLTALLQRWCALKPPSTYLLGVYVPLTKENRERLQTLGFSRYFDEVTGRVLSFEDEPPKKTRKRLLVILDRQRSSSFSAERVRDSLEQSFVLGEGVVQIVEQRDPVVKPLARISVFDEVVPVHHGFEVHTFKSSFHCGNNDLAIERARPSLFSYNHPLGACKECSGFGQVLQIDPKRCVPDHSKGIAQYALACWSGKAAVDEHQRLIRFCKEQGIPTDIPWSQLTPAAKDEIFNHKSRAYVGVYHWFRWLETKKYKMHVRVFLARYRNQVPCHVCSGTRLRTDALAYRINGLSIADVSHLPFEELAPWLSSVHSSLQSRGALPRDLKDVFLNLIHRVEQLVRLGLPYLSLARQARTLSGGETQRVNLVSAVGSNLISTHFVLDEPSVGLHARDTAALNTVLRDLTDKGNSLTVVEHDPDCLIAADTIVELGPAAGEHGGEVVFHGPKDAWRGLGIEPFTARNTPPTSPYAISIQRARARNLKSLDLAIPLQAFVCLSGVSGSGKSSLLTEVLQAGYARHTGADAEPTDAFDSVKGFEHVGELLFVDQSPLAKSPRANIATYTKVWDRVRDLLAKTPDAEVRGLTKSSFSFNVDAGRCPHCEGAGFIREDMQFLSDVFIQCEVCLGTRFQAPVLEVTYREKNVHELLSMSVDACGELFADDSHIAEVCSVLSKLGLGHITLGHPLSELSGGEAQRLKLVPHIVEGGKKKSLFLFDEPTTGLHVRDVERLIALFRFLVSQGHSILCVEHNLRLIAAADWVIDLGPEGGARGGYLVKAGTPAEFVANPSSVDGRTSLTAVYLKEFVELFGEKAVKPQAPKGRSKKTQAERRVKKSPPTHIHIRGAREHNLKNISLSIPLNTLITLTGVSGSGKSTIAKDILYAEGQRRYLDCLSPYARQFIKELKKPAIQEIENVQPTICVYQHTFQPSALSTVATMSEIYNFLRLLYAKVGTQFCPDHPEESISPLSSQQIAEFIKANYAGHVRLLAPIIVNKKGHHKPVFQRAVEMEISDVRVDGGFVKPSRLLEDGLAKSKSHSIEFVTARFTVRNMPADLITEGVVQALSLGAGTMIVESEGSDRVFSSHRTCAVCQRGFFKPDPEDLSFNSKRGRCPTCDGFGVVRNAPCKTCGGTRLNEIGRNIRLFGENIFELCQHTATEVDERLRALKQQSEGSARDIAAPIMLELHSKLSTLMQLGLDHLSLNRACTTLSGGELQRLRLGTAVGTPLCGVTYIFDEPSAGLHPVDNKRVLDRLRDLKDRGNTVIQIEHEIDNIQAAEHIIDVGPWAGSLGGEIVYQGDLAGALASPTSKTGEALRMPLPFSEGTRPAGPQLSVARATKNNLKNISVDVPLGALVTVAGVSGAGKSSLVHGMIGEALANGLDEKGVWKSPFGTVTSALPVERYLCVDQQPIGKTSRSTPASYLGIWDEIRKVFAETLDAKSRGWSASYFSHNTGKGRCQTCKGQGETTLEMSFLAEAKMVCESCLGRRFALETEQIRFRDKSVSEVLGLTFEEARTFFVNHRKIHQVCRLACEVGLGYLTLGQSSATLSGGESQRLKLVAELHLTRKGHTVYILDEPTTGLHRLDVHLLLKGLRNLVDQGHSVIIIEHDGDTIAQSDWVIEVGPGAGEQGGTIIFEGTPTELRAAATPWGDTLRERIALHGSGEVPAMQVNG